MMGDSVLLLGFHLNSSTHGKLKIYGNVFNIHVTQAEWVTLCLVVYVGVCVTPLAKRKTIEAQNIGVKTVSNLVLVT